MDDLSTIAAVYSAALATSLCLFRGKGRAITSVWMAAAVVCFTCDFDPSDSSNALIRLSSRSTANAKQISTAHNETRPAIDKPSVTAPVEDRWVPVSMEVNKGWHIPAVYRAEVNERTGQRRNETWVE